jgi:hypothetical protein
MGSITDVGTGALEALAVELSVIPDGATEFVETVEVSTLTVLESLELGTTTWFTGVANEYELELGGVIINVG